LCRCVYILEELEIEKEFYFCLKQDRKYGCPSLTYGLHQNSSPGTEVKYKKILIDIAKGLDIKTLATVGSDLGIDEKKSEIIFLIQHLYDCFL